MAYPAAYERLYHDCESRQSPYLLAGLLLLGALLLGLPALDTAEQQERIKTFEDLP